MLDPATVLTSGIYSDALNADFSTGRPRSRNGIIKLPWTSRVVNSSGDPQPFDVIYGATEYEANDGTLWQIIIADGKAYRMRSAQAATEIQCPPGSDLNTPCSFAQTTAGLCLFRGPGFDNLIMPSLDVGFQTMVQTANAISGTNTENPTDGTQDIPQVYRGDWIGNRLFFPFSTATEKDLLGISDFLNPTRHLGVRAQTRINQGSGSTLLRVVKFSDGKAVCFKERSVHVLNNVLYDLSTMRLDDLTLEYGLAAPDAVVTVGKDLWFLAAERGIVSITQTQTNQLQGVDVPKSREIHPLISRINWRYAKGAVAIANGNYVYFAVPLDDARGKGANMVPAGSAYSAGTYALNVEVGKDYYWSKGASDTACVNGAETLNSSGYFTASATTVTLQGAGSITAKIQRVYEGVNNTILVYNTLMGAWSGRWEGGFVGIKKFITGTYVGETRVFAVTVDGFMALINELPGNDETAYWTLSSTNLADSLTLLVAGGGYVPTVPGTKYRFVPGVDWTSIQVGSTTYTGQVVDFVAPGSRVSVFPSAPGPATFTFELREIVWKLTVEDIPGYVTPRAFRSPDGTRGRQKHLYATLSTLNPKFRITALADGVSEAWQVSPTKGTWEQFDRQKYRKPWDRPNWDPTNYNSDHSEPYRQDYSIQLEENQVPSGQIQPGVRYLVQSRDPSLNSTVTYNTVKYDSNETFVGVAGVSTWSVFSGDPVVWAPDSYIILGDEGVNPEELQTTDICRRLPAKCRGISVRPKIEWERGVIQVDFVGLTATKVDRSNGTRV